MAKKGSSVVKVDSALLSEVESFIKKSENKFKFINKKHFVDIAISEYLNSLKEGKA